MRRIVLCIVAVFILLFRADVYGFDYVVSTNQCPPGDPSAKPQRGVPFLDPCFHTTIVRVTDAAKEGDGSIVLRYAKFSPENSNETLALFIGRPGYLLYNVDRRSSQKYSLVRIANLPYGNGEARWAGSDPNIIYFTDRMGFYKYDCRTNNYSLIRDFSADFPSGTMIYMDDEGDSSYDSRYWAWFVVENGEKARAFSYDKDAEISGMPDKDGKPGEILGTLDSNTLYQMNGRGPNWIGVTDSGRKIVIGGSGGTYHTGSWNIDFTNPVYLAAESMHSDTGIDVNGNEVLFGFDLGPIDGWWMIDLATGKRTLLLRRPWPNPADWTGASFGNSTGTSCMSKPGWGLFSGYSGGDCSVGDKFDCTLVYMIELKDVGHEQNRAIVPRVWQIAHAYSSGCYSAQPNAVINKSGTRVYFTSKWNYKNQCASGDVYDVYVVELPETWYADLAKPSAPDVTPPSPPRGLSAVVQ